MNVQYRSFVDADNYIYLNDISCILMYVIVKTEIPTEVCDIFILSNVQINEKQRAEFCLFISEMKCHFSTV